MQSRTGFPFYSILLQDGVATVIVLFVRFYIEAATEQDPFSSYMGVFVDCVTKTARKCSAEHQRVAKQIIDYYAEDILSTVCVKWKYNSKACKGLPKISPVPSPKYKALLAPLAEVLASLQ